MRGLWIALMVACGFATNSALARLAYEGGSNALTVLTVRSVTALIALAVLLAIMRVPARLIGGRRNAALALGLLMAGYSYGLLGSIQYVPLAVGLVTFYTYPLLTTLVSAFLGRERLDPLVLAALLVALVGLALVLNLTGAAVNMTGVFHALAASICFTALLLLSDRVRGDGDSRPITLHMLVCGTGCYLIACLIPGAFVLPSTFLGWLGLVGCPVFFTIAFISLFEAVRMAGPVRAALVLNLEPVASALLGYVLLDQLLSAWQVFGMTLVVTAVVTSRSPVLIGDRLSREELTTLFISGIGLLLMACAALVYR